MPMPRFCLDDTVQISEDVVFRELDGEAVLLHLGTGIYFGLNEVGTRIWTLLGQNGSLQSVLDDMLKQYDAAPDRLEKDLLPPGGQMREKGLVQENLPTPVYRRTITI